MATRNKISWAIIAVALCQSLNSQTIEEIAYECGLDPLTVMSIAQEAEIAKSAAISDMQA